MIRRYEIDDGSTKFWEIETKDDVSFVCRWGKVGAIGRNERNYAFADAAAATKAADKLIAERTKKGFAPIARAVSGPPAAGARATLVSSAKPKRAGPPSNPQLEALLADKPDDVGTWQVYADWLQEHGEPWGAVIAAATTGKRPRTQQDEATKWMLGGLDNSSIEWRFGTVDKVSLCPEEEDSGSEGEGAEDDSGYARALQRILRHPAGRLVRELELGLPPSEDIDWSFDTIIPALTKAGPLPLLGVLDLTPDAEFMDQDSWRRIGDLSKLWAAAPRLRELRLKGSEGSEGTPAIKLGDIVAPRLETLVYISSGLDKSVPRDIGRAQLPELRRLELYVGQEDYGNNCKLKSFADIFDGKGLPQLEYLGIENSEWDAKLIVALARAPIVKRLKTLDLTKGTMYRKAAAALIDHAAAFRHLDKLDLDDNYFPDAECQAIAKAIPCAHLGDQKEADDPDDVNDDGEPYRYVTVGE